MKTIKIESCEIVNGEVTIKGKLVDQEFDSRVNQQQTVHNTPKNNKAFARSLRLTEKGLFTGRNGAKAMALDVLSWAEKVAPVVEPSLTFPPIIETVSAHVEAGQEMKISVVSELPVTYQWLSSATNDGPYVEIPGAVAPSLVAEDNLWYRCRVTNASGTTE